MKNRKCKTQIRETSKGSTFPSGSALKTRPRENGKIRQFHIGKKKHFDIADFSRFSAAYIYLHGKCFSLRIMLDLLSG